MSTHHSRLRKLFNILIGPNPRIEDKTQRQQSILLSSFQLAMIPFAVLTILTGDLLNNVEFLLFAAIAAILATYSITRILTYEASAALIVSLYTFLPVFIWLSVADWQPFDIPRIMPYVIVALALGALFYDERVVLIQGVVISLILVCTVGLVHGIPLMEYDNHLLTVGVLSFMVIVFSRLINSYLDEMNKQSVELRKQNRELEIYTRLLRHDLANDLQVIMNSVELSKLFLPVNLETVDENLERSLSFGERMQKLLHVFRLPTEQPDLNLVENLQSIALDSERTHGNLSIEVSWTGEAEIKTITAGRLLPLVWTNIFRNASQHAGENPIVSVDISVVDHQYHIVITDDGPGIPANVREDLFVKDTDFQHQDRGIGLYLSKLIIESHGGTIEISNTPETQFVITIPTTL
ncbi:MAG: sensor histidine kinase [Candidatus Hermodarchaeota archaeon]